MADAWGWAGSVEEFLAVDGDEWSESLQRNHLELMGMPPPQAQCSAWVGEGRIMRAALDRCRAAAPIETASWAIAFEYELPMEGGRRPDVVVLAGGSLVVLEFKSTALPQQGDLDQVHGYVRDLVDYHHASHVHPIATNSFGIFFNHALLLTKWLHDMSPNKAQLSGGRENL